MIFVILLVVVATLLFLNLVPKVTPFLSLLSVSIFGGFLLKMKPEEIYNAIQVGIGNTMSGIALILMLGAMFGAVLLETGAVTAIATALIRFFGHKYLVVAILVCGMVVGLPLFYNAGFVILIPFIYATARLAKVSSLSLGLPMACALSVTHGYLPPHPGPVAIISIFKANFGLTFLYGFAVAIPAIFAGGYLLARILSKAAFFSAVDDTNPNEQTLATVTDSPGTFVSTLIAITPVLFLAASALQKILGFAQWPVLALFEKPEVALLIALLGCFYLLGVRKGIQVSRLNAAMETAVKNVSSILLVILGAGILKQVLIDSQVSQSISSMLSHVHLPALFLIWTVTAIVRITIGSATVAAITAAGLLLPLVTKGSVNPELAVLAIGAGSLMGSHLNDTGFWMFKGYFNLSIPQTFVTWTLMESTVSVVGLVGVLILGHFLH